MAYINVELWSSDQVTDWLKGEQYMKSFYVAIHPDACPCKAENSISFFFCFWFFDAGLDNSMYKYIHSFTNNEIRGQALLNIRPYELNELGMHKIGHQEIVLEGIEQLRNFNYNMQKENLQYLALQVASTATNLHKLLYYFNKSSIETQILNDITHTIATIKPLVFWLDRSPFQGKQTFMWLMFTAIRFY